MVRQFWFQFGWRMKKLKPLKGQKCKFGLDAIINLFFCHSQNSILEEEEAQSHMQCISLLLQSQWMRRCCYYYFSLQCRTLYRVDEYPRIFALRYPYFVLEAFYHRWNKCHGIGLANGMAFQVSKGYSCRRHDLHILDSNSIRRTLQMSNLHATATLLIHRCNILQERWWRTCGIKFGDERMQRKHWMDVWPDLKSAPWSRHR